MTFNRNDFLDWAQNAKTNPANTQYQDNAKQFVNRATNPEIAAINSILDGGKNIIGKDNNSFRDANRQVEESAEKLDEAFPRKISTAVVDDRPTDRELADKSDYLKPSTKQLKTGMKKRKENMKDPVMIVKGRDKMGGHVQQKTITGQDMENAAGYRRKAKIAKKKTPMGTGKSLVGRIFGKK